MFKIFEKFNILFSFLKNLRSIFTWIFGGIIGSAMIGGHMLGYSHNIIYFLGWIFIAIFIIFLIIDLIRFIFSEIDKGAANKVTIVLQEIIKQYFFNETVVLDGKKFINCQFDNCTIQYNGGDFVLDNSIMAEGCKVRLTTKEAVATLHLIAAAKLLSRNNKLIVLDKYNRQINFDIFEK